MPYTDDCGERIGRHARILGAMLSALALAGCGELGSTQFTPGQFRIHGLDAYANEADLQKEAARACPRGFSKIKEFQTEGPADYESALFLDIICNHE